MSTIDIRLKLLPVGERSGFLVTCADCGRELGQVRDKAQAYNGAGQYIHDCKGKPKVSSISDHCPKCGARMAYGDHELPYCPNRECAA